MTLAGVSARDTALTRSQKAEPPLSSDLAGSAALIMFLAAATLAKMPIANGLTVGDVLFLAGATFAWRITRGASRTSRTRWNLNVVLLVLWAAAGALFATFLSPFPFSDVEFAKSLLRLLFMGAGGIQLVSLMAMMTRTRAASLLTTVMTINAVIAVALYLAMVIWPAAISADFAWLGSISDVRFAGRTASDLVRAQGLFNEPAHLGWFQSVGIGYLVFIADRLPTRSDWQFWLIFGSIVLTFSLGSYALLAAVGVGALFRRGAYNHRKNRLALSTVGLVLMALTFIVVLRPTPFREAIVERTSTVLEGRDRSANRRLAQSSDLAWQVVKESPLVGAGLGNVENVAAFLGYTTASEGDLERKAPTHNAIAFALGATGVIGAILLLGLMTHVGRVNPAAGILLLLAAAIAGGLLLATFWVTLGLYRGAYPAIRRRRPAVGIHKFEPTGRVAAL